MRREVGESTRQWLRRRGTRGTQPGRSIARISTGECLGKACSAKSKHEQHRSLSQACACSCLNSRNVLLVFDVAAEGGERATSARRFSSTTSERKPSEERRDQNMPAEEDRGLRERQPGLRAQVVVCGNVDKRRRRTHHPWSRGV